MEEIYVLFVRPYDLIDEDSGERIVGVSVHYIDRSMVVNDGDNGVGYPVIKNSVSTEKLSSFKTVPGLYNAKFRTYISKGNRVSKLDDVEFKSNLSVFGNK